MRFWVLVAAWLLLITAFSAAEYTTESVEYNLDYSYTQPINSYLDPSLSPSAQAETTLYAHSYEYNMQPAFSTPVSGHLNPSGSPVGQADQTLYSDSPEYTIQSGFSIATSTQLDPAGSPSGQADYTVYGQSYEYKILPVFQIPQTTHLDPSQATEQTASNTIYAQSVEYNIRPSLSSPKNLKKFYITDSSGQPAGNVQLDAVNTNTDAIEAQSITGSGGNTTATFREVASEHQLAFFNIIKSTYSMSLVPEGYTGAPLDHLPINITVNNLSSNMWANEKWKYQIPMSITVGSSGAKDQWVKKEINFMEYLETLGKTTTFDINSVRIVEVDAHGVIIDEKVSDVTPK